MAPSSWTSNRPEGQRSGARPLIVTTALCSPALVAGEADRTTGEELILKQPGGAVDLLRRGVMAKMPLGITRPGGTLGEILQHRGFLLHGAQRGPDGGFDGVVAGRHEGLRRI